MVQVNFLQWAIILIIIFVMGIIIILGPVHKKYLAAQKESEALSKKVESADKLVKSMQNIETIGKQLRDRFLDMKAKTLQPGDQIKVISLLTQATQELGIDIVSMNSIGPVKAPSTPSTQAPALDPAGVETEADKKFIETFFSVALESSYENLGLFIEKLEENPLLLMVDNFTVIPFDDWQNRLSVKMTILAYEEKT